MKVCEFLLQKEGDRVWLPLEPPTVEILEGRYRVVARTQQPQTEVFVEVSYWSPEDMPPKRRTRHWNRRTNTKGIMPVLPFTTLRSGNWRIQCSSDLLEDLEDGGWQHIVELRVLAQEDDREDWQRNPVTSSTSSGASPTRSRDRQPETSSASPRPTPPPALDRVLDQSEVLPANQTEVAAMDPPLDPAESLGQAEETRRARVEDLRSLAEQMAHLVMDTVLEAGEREPVPAPEDDETREFFTVEGGSGVSLDVSPRPEPDRPIPDLMPGLSLDSPLDSTPNPAPVSSEIEAPSTLPTPIESEPVSIATLPEGIQLQLQSNTIVPSPYSLFELHGYIVTANGAPLLESPLPLQARVMLKNPSNMEVRLAMTHLLATQPIDQPFYLSGHIALDWRNQLLLGEVQLQSLSLSVDDLTEDVITIATAAFTLMPSVDALLTQVSPPEVDSGALEEEPPSPEVAPPRKQIRADFLEVTRRSPPSSVPGALPTQTVAADTNASTVVMPPSLKPVSPVGEGTRSSPNLPTFIHPTTELSALVNSALVNDVVTEAVTDGAESLTEVPTDLASSVSPDRESSEDSSLNFGTAQLTLLNLADWTDPSIAIEEDLEQQEQPRRSIELPPVPSRSPQEEERVDFLAPEPLDPELSVAELNAFASEVAFSAAEQPEEDAIVDFAEPDAAIKDFDAENEILLSLDAERESQWSPSVLTTVLDSDRSLQLSPDRTSLPDSDVRTVVAPENTDPPIPPDLPEDSEESPALHLSPSEPDQSPGVASAESSLAIDNEPLDPWEDEPTVQAAEPEAMSDFGVGEFFSYEALPTVNASSPNASSPNASSPNVSSPNVSSPNVSPPDPILDNFFTEAVPEAAAVPPSLSFATEAESLEQVQVPPHLELSDVDLSDLELWDLEASAPHLADPPERQSEPFIPEHLRREIVVEDEWLEPDTRHWMSSAPPQVMVAWPEEEPLPLPGLELPSEDLVGGETIRVTVQLPETSSRLAVKLWLIDCQSRSLAAGPFWAYQFLPTLPQRQEAILEIPVPLGCLEVQFEALTIEAETQRESHKFTVVKAIVPPDLQEPEENLLPPDEFLDYLPPALELPENDRLS